MGLGVGSGESGGLGSWCFGVKSEEGVVQAIGV
jgi:hypothetical protein